MGRNFRSISLPPDENLSLSIGKNYGYAYNKENIYSWGYSDDLILRSGKQIFGKTALPLNGKNLHLQCCDSFGIGVMDRANSLNLEQFYEENFEQNKPKKILEEDENPGRRQRQEDIENEAASMQRIINLENENREQKQVINMFM